MIDSASEPRTDGFFLPTSADVELPEFDALEQDAGQLSTMYGQQIALAVQGLLQRRDEIRDVQVAASRVLAEVIANRPSQIIVDLDHPQNIWVDQPTRPTKFSSADNEFGDFMNGGTRTENMAALPVSFLGRHLYVVNNGVYRPHPLNTYNSEPMYSPVITHEQLLNAPLSNHPIGATMPLDDDALVAAASTARHPALEGKHLYEITPTDLAKNRIDLCLPGLASKFVELRANEAYLAGNIRQQLLFVSLLIGSSRARVTLHDVVVRAHKVSKHSEQVKHTYSTAVKPDAKPTDGVGLTHDEAAAMLATSAFGAIDRMIEVTKRRVVPQSEVRDER